MLLFQWWIDIISMWDDELLSWKEDEIWFSSLTFCEIERLPRIIEVLVQNSYFVISVPHMTFQMKMKSDDETFHEYSSEGTWIIRYHGLTFYCQDRVGMWSRGWIYPVWRRPHEPRALGTWNRKTSTTSITYELMVYTPVCYRSISRCDIFHG